LALMTKQIEDYTKYREKQRKEAEEFIKQWVELKKVELKRKVHLKRKLQDFSDPTLNFRLSRKRTE